MNAKTKKFLGITVKTLLVVVLVMWLFGAWYKSTYSMKEATPREINDPALATKVLIATQGSKFKDDVVSGVVEKLVDRPIYIKVMDVSQLANVKTSDWTAIVVIHTWEMGKPPKSVSDFITTTNNGDVIILTTSGDGHYHMDGVDGITSASKASDVDLCVREILNRIEIKIAPEEISNFQ